jgi:hypothetical protein
MVNFGVTGSGREPAQTAREMEKSFRKGMALE